MVVTTAEENPQVFYIPNHGIYPSDFKTRGESWENGSDLAAINSRRTKVIYDLYRIFLVLPVTR